MIYNNAYIYKLSLPNSPLIYYGSSTKKISNRFEQHRSGFHRYKAGSGNYTASYKLFENNNIPVIELIEELKNVTKQELLQCERSYIESNICVNKNMPYRTYTEKLEYARQYHKNHFDIINNRKNEKIICDVCNRSVSRTNITHHNKSKLHKNLINI